MQSKVINVLFCFFTCFYFVIGQHYYVLTQELCLSNFASPVNLITLIYASIICCLGFWTITLKKMLAYSNIIFFLIASFSFSILVYLYHLLVDDNAYIVPVIGTFFTLLLVLSLSQIGLSKNYFKFIVSLLVLSPLIEAINGIINFHGIEFYPFRSFSGYGTFSSASSHCTYIIIGFLITLLICSKSNISTILKGIINSISFTIAFYSIFITNYILSITILCLSLCIYIIYLCTLNLIKNIPLIVLSIAFIAIIIYLSTLININEQNSVSLLSASFEIFLNNMFIGTGYDTYDKQILNYFLDNPISNINTNTSNIILVAMVEGGIVGLITILCIFFFITSSIITIKKPISSKIGLFMIIFPILLLPIENNPYDRDFAYIILIVFLTIYAYIHGERNLNYKNVSSKFIPIHLSLIIPTVTILFSVTGLNSLNTIQKEVLSSKIITELESKKFIFNPFVRYKDYQVINAIYSANLSMNTGVIYYSLEAKENMDLLSKYSTSPKLYKSLIKTNNLLTKYKTQLNVKYNFEQDSNNAERVYKFLQNNYFYENKLLK